MLGSEKPISALYGSICSRAKCSNFASSSQMSTTRQPPSGFGSGAVEDGAVGLSALLQAHLLEDAVVAVGGAVLEVHLVGVQRHG
jgi:hypothetical protein